VTAPSPLLPAASSSAVAKLPRAYDRAFDWMYDYTPPARPDLGVLLVPITWDGLNLNPGDMISQGGLCTIVENVTGWLDSPPLDGNDTALVISDGSAWGPKVLGARTIVISGAVAGPRDQLAAFRDQLAVRAASRQPADLSITDDGLGRTLTAQVRADTAQYQQTWVAPVCWRYQVTLTAADPVLYEDTWQTATLSPTLSSTGRLYQKVYQWTYGSQYQPNTALLTNEGTVPAKVFAIYTGDLGQSILSDEEGNQIIVGPLAVGEQVQVETDTLTALAAGGISRASYVQPGSTPMDVDALSTERWHLAVPTGAGYITLAWRSAWV
jgi:hypothetical protein